jgi:hypothetical protein
LNPVNQYFADNIKKAAKGSHYLRWCLVGEKPRSINIAIEAGQVNRDQTLGKNILAGLSK